MEVRPYTDSAGSPRRLTTAVTFKMASVMTPNVALRTPPLTGIGLFITAS